jgi:hypothetical protein
VKFVRAFDTAMQSHLSDSLHGAQPLGRQKPDAASAAPQASNVLQMPLPRLQRQTVPDPAIVAEFERERAYRAAFAQGIRLSHTQLQTSYRAAIRQGVQATAVGLCVLTATVTLATWLL